MSLTAVYGAPGIGKGAFLTAWSIHLYLTEGLTIMNKSIETIKKYNEKFDANWSYPKRVPIYSDYEIKFKYGYEKYYSTYFLNGYYFGLENDELAVQHVVPCAKVFLTEVQRYYDSRKSATLPDFVSRLYEMHRHWYMDIFLDLQRLGLLDLNIRELLTRVIHLEKFEILYNEVKAICGCVWHGREFTSAAQADAYIDNGVNVGKLFEFAFEGNIFDCYDSFSNAEKFLPKKTSDFSFHEHGVKSIYSDIFMPDGYRATQGKADKNNKVKRII